MEQFPGLILLTYCYNNFAEANVKKIDEENNSLFAEIN